MKRARGDVGEAKGGVDMTEEDRQETDEDEEVLIERSRQRRLQILAKHGKGAEHRDALEAPEAPEAPEAAPAPAPAHPASPPPQSSDEDDMFADTPEDADEHPGAKCKPTSAKGLADNYDDAEGYYNFQVGEVLGGRYEVFATHGKGVFSSVLRARDLRSTDGGGRDAGTSTHPQLAVAVKVIRANDTMFKAGQMEKVILNKLSQADPQNKMHCIRMLDSFEYRSHLCLVFEAMDMNLRDLTKKYGRGIGLHISAVRTYATQMLIALDHMKTCGVVHADIKPDNILVNESRSAIKICDFGSAMFSGDNTITPYLVSRFYRAPEIILGLPYDHPLDMWSVGCVVYELFTGQILFPGRTNNEMLKFMMDVKGAFPKKMVKKAEFGFKHFADDTGEKFCFEEQDLLTKQMVSRTIEGVQVDAKKTLGRRCASSSSAERKQVAHLVDLLERVLTLDPDKRITPAEALNHPFIAHEANANTNKAPKAPRPTFSSRPLASALRQKT
jgi:serine/threonine-protein kinase PRP4